MQRIFGDGAYRYALVEDWEQRPRGLVHHDIADLAIGADDHVFLFRRDDPPIVEYRPDGSHVRSFGEGAIVGQAHGITVDPRDGTVLCVDKNGHAVVRLDAEGRVVQRIASLRDEPVTSEYGDPENVKESGLPFKLPTAIAVAPDGRMYVTDGNGTFLDEMTDMCRPNGVAIDALENVYATEFGGLIGRYAWAGPPAADKPWSRVSIWSPDLQLAARWGTAGGREPGSSSPHTPSQSTPRATST